MNYDLRTKVRVPEKGETAMNENVSLNDRELEQVSGGASGGSGGAVVKRAVQELGKPYAWGAVGPEAYDNSGLVSYCLTGVHARLGTTSTFLGWTRVSDPQPGDVCVSASHCGIYVGPGEMIHAPMFGAVVSYGPIQSGMIIVRR